MFGSCSRYKHLVRLRFDHRVVSVFLVWSRTFVRSQVISGICRRFLVWSKFLPASVHSWSFKNMTSRKSWKRKFSRETGYNWYLEWEDWRDDDKEVMKILKLLVPLLKFFFSGPFVIYWSYLTSLIGVIYSCILDSNSLPLFLSFFLFFLFFR
jgi:hypothetical protein